MMPSAPASTWAGRPDVSDIENFWTAPLADRAAAFAALREREPVSFFSEPEMSLHPRGPGYWALTRLDDVVEASRNPRSYLRCGRHQHRRPPPPPEFLEFYGSMINMDDPRHTRLRRIVSRGFTPRRLDGLLSDVTHTARSMVDDIIDAGECDAVRAISARLPLHLVDEIPVSAAGKVLKRELRDRLTKEVGAERQRQPSDPALTPDG